MRRVLEECDRAQSGLAPDPVHDLRVALRRCRSMADGLMALDPDPAWKQMKKAGKALFSSLGELRDVQVMAEWVQRLGPADDPETKALLNLLRDREREHKLHAAEALHAFDARQWRKWARELPRRASRVRRGSLIFKHLALERWMAAYDLHRRALRNRSQVAFHELRIGIKRLRYIVENFLPQQHATWSKDLKDMQDLLGEVHDLDVLWATAQQVNAFPDPQSRTRWREVVKKERTQRLAQYRERMLGHGSLWRAWRAELPHGDEIHAAAMARVRLWASLLDPDFGHAQHVAHLADQLLEELNRLGVSHLTHVHKLRPILSAAALLHDVGLAKREKGHHKASSELIGKIPTIHGWSAHDRSLVSAVARFHRGALPRPHHKALAGLLPEQVKEAVFLSGILRLANAFDCTRDRRVTRLRVEPTDGALTLWAEGFRPMSNAAEQVAASRYLLETTLHRPILVKNSRTLDKRPPSRTAHT